MVSKDSLNTFFILLLVYFLIAAVLLGLSSLGICKFQSDLTSIENLIFSLPMVALYLLVFLAATAGYAQGKEMLEKLPLSARLENELNARRMESAGIKTKIRAGSQANKDDSFLDVVNNMVSSRIPLLAVVDKDNDKDNGISGVITATDLLLHIQKILKDENAKLENLKDSKAEDIIGSKDLVSVKVSDNLQAVTEAMIKNQYSKIFVTEDSNKISGTIDALDVLAELLD